MKGVGDQIDYGMRVYDPRVSRFLTNDPLFRKYPQLTPYQYASNNPVLNIDIDGLEGQGFWSLFWKDPANTIMHMSWDEANEAAGGINNMTGAGNVINGSYQTISGKDPISGQPASRIDGLGNVVIGGIFHYSFTKLATPAASLERQMAENAAVTTNKQATSVHGDNTEAAQSNAATKSSPSSVSATQTATQVTTNRSAPSTARATTVATKRAKQLSINAQNGTTSEDIVFKRLESQLGSDEAILRRPRIYIGDGSSGEYSNPDFLIYNTKTGQIGKIVDAKDGTAQLTSQQAKLNEQGGTFYGSSRATRAAPQSVKPGQVQVERTNVGQQATPSPPASDKPH